MPRFSLVIATLGRTEELAKLLASIASQGRSDVEVLVVDQNADDRVAPLLRGVPERVSVRHLRVAERNVSAARNAGLDQARGEIVAFPDDDCWYPAGLLDEVDGWFRAHGEYAVLAVGAVDDQGLSSGNRWVQDACEIRSWNALRTTFCSSLFISAVERSREVRFDPSLARGEETDFILRLLGSGRRGSSERGSGLRGRFDRRLHIHHPRRDMMSGTVTRERARSYGAGMGRLVRRHSLFVLWASLLGYDLARTVLVSLRGRFGDAVFCLAHAEGLFAGFVFPARSYE